jgi:hypothetical protein
MIARPEGTASRRAGRSAAAAGGITDVRCFALVDVADLLASGLADAVVGPQAVDLRLQVGVDGLELVELLLALGEDVVLPE